MRSLAPLLCVVLLAGFACGPRRDEARAMRERKDQPEVAREDRAPATAKVDFTSASKYERRGAKVSEDDSALVIGAADGHDPELVRALVDAAAGFEGAGTGLELSADPERDDRDLEEIFRVRGEGLGDTIEWSPALGSLDAKDFAR